VSYRSYIKQNKINSIVILTGAGISAESGIKTFRDNNGLWENHRVEEVATPEGFQADPGLVYRFYNLRRASLKDPLIQPNDAHFALSKLEKEFKNKILLVTQNVDDLHERSGSKNIIHMHGELNKIRCMKTNKVFGTYKEITSETECECCEEKGNLRPHIVWFGEMPFQMMDIMASIHSCDLFLSIGTSGVVYPAAGLVSEAKLRAKAYCLQINLDATENEGMFDETIKGKAGEKLPAVVDQILSLV
jgi:NAD-dependent deacetylase